jgi:hypothetical protein
VKLARIDGIKGEREDFFVLLISNGFAAKIFREIILVIINSSIEIKKEILLFLQIVIIHSE